MKKTKVCTNCHREKPIEEFYKLRKDRPWRRSKCISCHKERDRVNKLIRDGLYTLLLMLCSFSALSQRREGKEIIAQMRTEIVDSINYYREDPVKRVKESYGITLSKRYKPTHPYKQSKKITRSAQRWADKMARTNNYRHSGTKKYAESIDDITTWTGGYELATSRFIIDKGVRSKGHRKHMLIVNDDLIGVGIAFHIDGHSTSTFICIQTISSSSLKAKYFSL